MKKTIAISDIHLASKKCKAKKLIDFLALQDFDRLIIVGDLFDNKKFDRFKKRHWNILSLLRKLSKTKQIIWLQGNHDDSHYMKVMSTVIGCRIINEHGHYSMKIPDGKRIGFIHGHQFDTFISKNPIKTSIACFIYDIIQEFDFHDHRISRWIKRKSKSFVDLKKANEKLAFKYAKKHKFDIIVCGHTHSVSCNEKDFVQYVNCGSWVDNPCYYCIIDENKLEIKSF